MNNDEVSVRDILAKEGLGSFAFELETLHPDLESARLTRLLATVIKETQRLQDWRYRPPGQESAAKECYHLAQEAIENLSAREEFNYRRLLIIGYLYGRLTLPGREVNWKLSDLIMSRLAQTSGLVSSNAEQKKAHEWMRRLAQELWEKDEDESLRTGDVAKKVKEKLEELIKMLNERGYKGTEHWPLSDKVIRREIKDVAPGYASKPGARKKSNDN